MLVPSLLMVVRCTEPLAGSVRLSPVVRLVNVSVYPFPAASVRTTLPFRSVNSRIMRLSPVPTTPRSKPAQATPAGRTNEKSASAAEAGTEVPTAEAEAKATAAAQGARRRPLRRSVMDMSPQVLLLRVEKQTS